MSSEKEPFSEIETWLMEQINKGGDMALTYSILLAAYGNGSLDDFVSEIETIYESNRWPEECNCDY